MSGLDLALIGDSSVAGLLDAQARMVWSCLPRLDSEPAFRALLRNRGDAEERRGGFEGGFADLEPPEQA